MLSKQFIEQLNDWGATSTPFFFIVDFEQKKPVAFKLSELPGDVRFVFPKYSNIKANSINKPISFQTQPISLELYTDKFKIVEERLAYGDSFLANLTIKTSLSVDRTLSEIFIMASAPYKLIYKDEFVVYSPETFIKIQENKIYSYPMKGTIDADVPNAEDTILNDLKEMSEHVTIVDLIRNDLSIVANNVRVTRFRYVDKIKTNHKILLQVSSEIAGDLPLNWQSNLGTIISALLPAGSISGAPKERTIQIIQQAEGEPRGYYTGIMGYFDGEIVDSAVMIRYIEKANNQYFYRSGGGITTQSNCLKEYEEALAKVYVPVV